MTIYHSLKTSKQNGYSLTIWWNPLRSSCYILFEFGNVFNARFEAHMEVHVGSIDEEEDEQGIAHMIEHVAFLGSKKREKLLGTGARSNAYTDFHHTVFHIHSPTHTKVCSLLHLLAYLVMYLFLG